MKKWQKKGISCLLLIALVISAGTTSLADGGWSRISTSSKGNVQVGDGSSILIKGEDIQALTTGLNKLGEDFHAEKASVETQLSEMGNTVESLRSSFQSGVGRITAKLTGLGCTPEGYDSSAHPLMTCDQILEGIDLATGMGGTKVKAQQMTYDAQSELIEVANNHYAASFDMVMDELDHITAYNIQQRSGGSFEIYTINGNTLKVYIDTGAWRICNPVIATAYEIEGY